MTIFIVIILRGMKAFILNYLVGVGFCWRSVSTDFRAKNPGGCTKSPFSEDLRTEKLGGEACICAVFIYLFVYLLFVCMFAFVYFKGAVGLVMHKLCGRLWGIFLWSYVAVL